MLPSGLPELVADDEDLSRFLRHRSHFTTTVTKHSAFLPSTKSRDTSVFRIGHDPERLCAIWGKNSLEPLKGYAVLKTKSVRAVGLEVVADEPPAAHANIIRWPWLDDAELQKAKQKELAILLASASVPVLL